MVKRRGGVAPDTGQVDPKINYGGSIGKSAVMPRGEDRIHSKDGGQKRLQRRNV